MKKLLATFILALIALSGKAQLTTIYKTSFNGWTLSGGWQILDFDTSSVAAGSVIRRHLNTTSSGYSSSEFIDSMLGVKEMAGACNQILISPEFQLGSNPWIQLYSKVGYAFGGNGSMSLWVLPDPSNTSLGGITDSIAPLSSGGFNNFSLGAYANTSVRIAIRYRGNSTSLSAYIDDLHIFNKDHLAYIPDQHFRTYLQTIIPTAFVGDSLDFTVSAAAKLRRVIAPNSNISSLEGLKYFPYLGQLSASHNQITNITVDRIPYLDSIVVSYNQLTYLPDMPVATYVVFDHNIVSSFPNFYNTTISQLNANDNVIYSCLPPSNRFVLGSVLNNIRVYAPGTYYSLQRSNAEQMPPYPPCVSGGAIIDGWVYYDQNNNNIKDAGEAIPGNNPIYYTQNGDIFTDAGGHYHLATEPGNVQLNVIDLPNYFSCATPFSASVVAGQNIAHDFRIVANTQANDLKVTVTRQTPYSTSNGMMGVAVLAENLGTDPITATIKIPIPNNVTFNSSYSGTVINDTLVWTTNILPFGNGYNSIGMTASAALDYQTIEISACGQITTADVNMSNNCSSVYFYKDVYVPPHDPNYKLVSTPIVDTNFQDDLYYTVRFENTGAGNATYVRVRDQLSTMLDGTTFQLLGSTHPVNVSYGTDQLVQFTFNDIVLTPRSVDSTQSYGFIWFKIKPKNPMQLNDTIKNSVSIVFNTEAPIVTGTAIVYVDILREADNNISTTAHYCVGDVLNFADQSGANPIRWDWYSSIDNQFHATTKIGQLPLDTAGTFDVTLITTWDNGDSDTLVKTISVGQPNVQISAIPNICHENQAVTFDQGTPAGGNYTGAGISSNVLDATGLSIGAHTLNYSYTDAFGCSATKTANFIIEDDYTSTASSAICFGQTMDWEGTTYSASGLYIVTYARASGCDSILNLNLQITDQINEHDTLHACQGDTIQWNNLSLSQMGDYQASLVAVGGCDSIVNLHLNLHSLFALNNSEMLCSGGTVQWQGQTISGAGNYEVHYQTQFGCDSSYYLQVNAAPLFESHDTVSLCPNSSIEWFGTELSVAGDYSHLLTSQFGCDSSYYIHVRFYDVMATTMNQSICEGNSFYWNGTYLNTAGVYHDTLTSIHGCDSIVTLNLTVSTINNQLVLTDSSLLAVPGMDTYSWLDCATNALIPNETSQEFVFNANGVYASVVSNNQCVDTSSCFTIDFLQLNDESPLSDIQVYPNPFETNIKLDLPKNTSFNYSLNNLFGQEIIRGVIENGDNIHVDGIVPGVYLLKISSGDSQRTFILEHI